MNIIIISYECIKTYLCSDKVKLDAALDINALNMDPIDSENHVDLREDSVSPRDLISALSKVSLKIITEY